MKVVAIDPVPVEIDRLIAERQRLGLDGHDELWDGDYHMAPMAMGRHGYLEDELAALLRPYAEVAGLVGTGAVNIGRFGDFRVPDRAYHRSFDPSTVWFATAAVVVEVLSPGDETYQKFGFYSAHGVEEVLVVDPVGRRVLVYSRAGDGYAETGASAVLGFDVGTVEAAIRWP